MAKVNLERSPLEIGEKREERGGQGFRCDDEENMVSLARNYRPAESMSGGELGSQEAAPGLPLRQLFSICDFGDIVGVRCVVTTSTAVAGKDSTKINE